MSAAETSWLAARHQLPVRAGTRYNPCVAEPDIVESADVSRLGARDCRAGDDRGAHLRCLDATCRSRDGRVPQYNHPRRARGAAFFWLAGVGVVLAATNAARRSGRRAAGVETGCRRGLYLHPRLPLPAAGVDCEPRRPSGDALPRRHPEHHGPLDGGRRAHLGDYRAAGGPGRPLRRARHRDVDADANRPHLAARRRIAHDPAVVCPPLRGLDDVHGVSMGGLCVAGAACGVLLVAAQDRGMERRLHVWLALAGLGILLLGNYTASLPSIYRQSSFWTTSPTYFAIRVGILMTTMSAVYGLARALEPRGILLRPLAGSAAIRCSSTGSTWSWCTAMRRGRSASGCRLSARSSRACCSRR